MQDWLKTNAISILIAFTTLASTYALYGYRITQVEGRLNEVEQNEKERYEAISALATSMAVLAERSVAMQEDIKELKEDVGKLTNALGIR